MIFPVVTEVILAAETTCSCRPYDPALVARLSKGPCRTTQANPGLDRLAVILHQLYRRPVQARQRRAAFLEKPPPRRGAVLANRHVEKLKLRPCSLTGTLDRPELLGAADVGG